ncbi:MAG: four helix bundle protein [Nitrospirota bacterium]
MDKLQNSKQYDLEDRTLNFAKKIIEFVNKLPKTLSNIEISRQMVKASGSVGANYIEANESLSKKDFLMRVKICRKEAKETRYWLKLISCDKESEKERTNLIQESTELMKIFGAIIEKTNSKSQALYTKQKF